MENRDLFTHIFEYDGNACVCITQPDDHNNVIIYDLDSSQFHYCQAIDVREAKKFRKTEIEDFQWSAILDSRWSDEATQISYELFD